MNPWPFVIAAYALMLLATAGLLVWAVSGMRRAERAADALKRRD
ncbi:heme exporter protein CcmD [Sphingomonas sp.]|nr:heme exporter protein CcmD [Sphingomonas sp.]